jgi:hypothetical protein
MENKINLLNLESVLVDTIDFNLDETTNKKEPIKAVIGHSFNDYLRNFESKLKIKDYRSARDEIIKAEELAKVVVDNFGEDKKCLLGYQRKFLKFISDGFLEVTRILDKSKCPGLIPRPLKNAIKYTQFLGIEIPEYEKLIIRSYADPITRELGSLVGLTLGGVRYLDQDAGIRFNKSVSEKNGKSLELKKINNIPVKNQKIEIDLASLTNETDFNGIESAAMSVWKQAGLSSRDNSYK